jgi:1-acyl-sn-glycerol-3-phosphate acyltransferase
MTLAARARRHLAVAYSIVRTWAAAVTLASRRDPGHRRLLAATLARHTLDALAVRVRTTGWAPVARRPVLVVANHVSWLDVYALGAAWPARFVAKAETRAWPIAGAIARGFDAFFIVRGSVRDAARVRTAVAAALARGDSVVVFPEATTSDGTILRRFHPALFQAAIDAGALVQPVAIRYLRPDGRPSLSAAFVGDDTLVASLGRIVRGGPLTVDLHFAAALDTGRRTRRELAALAQAAIADALGLPRAAVTPPLLPRIPVRRRPAA